MGQKGSTLVDVFPWKDSDSSKNNDVHSGGNGSRSGPSNAGDARARPDQHASAKTDQQQASSKTDQQQASTKTDQQHASTNTVPQMYENFHVPNVDTLLDTLKVDRDRSKCGNVPTTDVETASTNSLSMKKKWAMRFNCSRPKSKDLKCCNNSSESVPESNDVKRETCECPDYLGTEALNSPDRLLDVTGDSDDSNDSENLTREMIDFETAFRLYNHHSELVLPSFSELPRVFPRILPRLPFSDNEDDAIPFDPDMDLESNFVSEDFEDIAYKERAKEIQEGIDPPPGFRSEIQLQVLGGNLPESATGSFVSLLDGACTVADDMDGFHKIHTSVDYIHYLVPDLLQITKCSFYWGKMDRYEAEKLLEDKPEGTFLLRDSAQEEYLFSVSFRKYGRSLHARIEQWNHLFSFDSRDPGVFASSTVCGLIEHYKDPTCCMFFEPMLTIPLNRNFTFSLQHACRAAICNQITYDDVGQLKLPKVLKLYLKEYHYKQRVRVRILDLEN